MKPSSSLSLKANCRDGRDLRDLRDGREGRDGGRDGKDGICNVTLTVKPTSDARQWVTTDLTTERQWLSGYQH